MAEKQETLSEKQTEIKSCVVMAKVVEHRPNKCDILSSSPRPMKGNKDFSIPNKNYLENL
jgi:hypothetical protein